MVAGRATTPTRLRRRIHAAWWVAVVGFVALLGADGFRSAPGLLMIPLEQEFGWSRSLVSAAVSLNLVLYGLVAPFAAALMDRFGIRRVVSLALLLVAAGSGLTVFVQHGWQLILTWGLPVGTGSMAMVFAAAIAHRGFVARRGLVMGILTAAGAAGQLVFLPVMATLVQQVSWRPAARSGCCARRPDPDLLGHWPAVSPSAGPRPTAWSGPTSSPPRMTAG